MPYFVAIGCVLDLLSTFLPWSADFGLMWFLPFSIPLPAGWQAHYIESLFVVAVSIMIRLAATLGLVALLLNEYLKSKIPKLLVAVSVVLSFVSVGIFFQIGWSLYFGAFSAVFAGVLKLLGLALENLQLELTLE